MNAQELLIKIDLDNEKTFGPIKINKYGGSNMYMNELEHRRWMHPDYQKYMEIKWIPNYVIPNNTTQDGSKIQQTK